jgi:monovalent cation:H+ antiporter-2, CPA2 family
MEAVELLELGLVVMGLALLARAAGRIGISTIPLYLITGLAFGRGGVLPLVETQEFIRIGAEIGLILLLFLLGLEYSARELTATMRSSARAGVVDLALNFPPGFVAALLLGWGPIPAAFLGGITYVSSSGIAAKLIHDLGRLGNRETPVVLAVLVLEDLVMAAYLPVLAALLAGGASLAGLGSAVVAVAAVALFLALAARLDVGLSRVVFSHSDEALLLTILGFAIAVAGIAELADVSAAVGALLAGIALSGQAAHGARALLSPLRDLFAAMFFVFVGFGIDPATIPPALGPALVLAAVTAATKVATGWWSAKGAGVGVKGRLRAGTTLIARGEFSVAIAGIAATGGLEPRLGPLTVSYVLALAVVGPIAARLAEPAGDRLVRRSRPA